MGGRSDFSACRVCEGDSEESPFFFSWFFSFPHGEGSGEGVNERRVGRLEASFGVY